MPNPKRNVYGSPPSWWHQRGYKMLLDTKQSNAQQVILTSSAAHVRITRQTVESTNEWVVEWEVCWSRFEKVNGSIRLSSDTLARAFALEKTDSGYIARTRPTDTQEDRKFIRSCTCLNIPRRGTGRDGDPNISIAIDSDIQHAVSTLLSANAL